MAAHNVAAHGADMAAHNVAAHNANVAAHNANVAAHPSGFPRTLARPARPRFLQLLQECARLVDQTQRVVMSEEVRRWVWPL